MSKKVIDVSSYQGVINWLKVKASGVQGAILKVIRKDLNPDRQFENNWKGCREAGIPIVGVYNYIYANTVAKARTAAQAVVKVLAGREAMVWLDVEDACMEGLGSELINIINAYAEIITGAGLKLGVYTGQYFYNTYIKPYGGVKYPLWIARYGLNNGVADQKYYPNPDKPEKFFAFPPSFKYNKEKPRRMCSCYLRINMLTRFMVRSLAMTA